MPITLKRPVAAARDESERAMSAADLMDFSPEVAEARSAKKPIVALESTIITHGMPYPRNVETARSVEEAVREMGAVPATIAVIDGRFRVGLSADEIERLGQLSRRRGEGLAARSGAVAARKGSAGTTVAATMFIASLAGIEMFATGGIGGVHRGAEETFDISADLVELSRTRVAVVCAGAKSILDIGKTLEFLETQGVAVVGYRTDEFPAFYARSSGFRLEHRCDGLHDLARMIRLQREIGPGGLLIANPIPAGSRARAGDDRGAHRRSGGGGEGARGGQEGGDAVPVEARGRTDRRAKPRGQYRADQEQRHARRAGGGGAGETVSPNAALVRSRDRVMFVRDHPPPIDFSRHMVRRKSSASGLPSAPGPLAAHGCEGEGDSGASGDVHLVNLKADRIARPGKEQVPGLPVGVEPYALERRGNVEHHEIGGMASQRFPRDILPPHRIRPGFDRSRAPRLHRLRRFACPPLSSPVKLDCWRMMLREAHDETLAPALSFVISIRSASEALAMQKEEGSSKFRAVTRWTRRSTS